MAHRRLDHAQRLSPAEMRRDLGRGTKAETLHAGSAPVSMGARAASATHGDTGRKPHAPMRHPAPSVTWSDRVRDVKTLPWPGSDFVHVTATYSTIERQRQHSNLEARRGVHAHADARAHGTTEGAFKLSEVLAYAPQLFTPERVHAHGRFIATIDALPYRFQHARIVFLSQNQLQTLAGVEQFEDATSISVAHNVIEDLRELAHLRSCQRLAHLAIEGNPCCDRPFARLRALLLLVNLGIRLQSLDGVVVSREELNDATDVMAAHHAALTLCATQEIRALHLAHVYKSMCNHAEMLRSARVRGMLLSSLPEAFDDDASIPITHILKTLDIATAWTTAMKRALVASLERRAEALYRRLRKQRSASAAQSRSPALTSETVCWQRAFAELSSLQTRVCTELLLLVEKAGRELAECRRNVSRRDPLGIRRQLRAEHQSSLSAEVIDTHTRTMYDLAENADARRAAFATVLHGTPALSRGHEPCGVPRSNLETSSGRPGQHSRPTSPPTAADGQRLSVSAPTTPQEAARRAASRVRQYRQQQQQDQHDAVGKLIDKYTGSRPSSRGSSASRSGTATRATSAQSSRRNSADARPTTALEPSATGDVVEAVIDRVFGATLPLGRELDDEPPHPHSASGSATGSPTRLPPSTLHDWRRASDGRWQMQSGHDVHPDDRPKHEEGRSDDVTSEQRASSSAELTASRVWAAIRASEATLVQRLQPEQGSAPSATVRETAAPPAPATANPPAAPDAHQQSGGVDLAIDRLLQRIQAGPTTAAIAAAAPAQPDVEAVLHAATTRLRQYRDDHERLATAAQTRIAALTSQLSTSRAATESLQARILADRPLLATQLPLSYATSAASAEDHAVAQILAEFRSTDANRRQDNDGRRARLQRIADGLMLLRHRRQRREHLTKWREQALVVAFQRGLAETHRHPICRRAFAAWRAAFWQEQRTTVEKTQVARRFHERRVQAEMLRRLVLYLVHRRSINSMHDQAATFHRRHTKARSFRAWRSAAALRPRETRMLTSALVYRARRLQGLAFAAWRYYTRKARAARDRSETVACMRTRILTRIGRAAVRTWHDHASSRRAARDRADAHNRSLQTAFQRGLLRAWRDQARARTSSKTWARLTAPTIKPSVSFARLPSGRSSRDVLSSRSPSSARGGSAPPSARGGPPIRRTLSSRLSLASQANAAVRSASPALARIPSSTTLGSARDLQRWPSSASFRHSGIASPRGATSARAPASTRAAPTTWSGPASQRGFVAQPRVVAGVAAPMPPTLASQQRPPTARHAFEPAAPLASARASSPSRPQVLFDLHLPADPRSASARPAVPRLALRPSAQQYRAPSTGPRSFRPWR